VFSNYYSYNSGWLVAVTGTNWTWGLSFQFLAPFTGVFTIAGSNSTANAASACGSGVCFTTANVSLAGLNIETTSLALTGVHAAHVNETVAKGAGYGHANAAVTIRLAYNEVVLCYHVLSSNGTKSKWTVSGVPVA